MSEIPEYIDAKWTREVVDIIFARIEQAVIVCMVKAGDKEAAEEFNDIVIPHMSANIYENLAVQLTPVINNAIRHHLAAAAVMKGERMTITKHDDRGRIHESVKVPLWAPPLEEETKIVEVKS